MSRWLFLAMLVVAAWLPFAAASEPHHSGPTLGAPAAESAAGLVRQLGSNSWLVRQRATAALLQLGATAKPALAAAADSPDAEIRSRTAQILALVVETDFQQRIKNFAADVDGRKHVDLPGWQRFHGLVGDDPMARALFVAMYRAEAELMQSIADGPRAVSAELSKPDQINEIRQLARSNDSPSNLPISELGGAAALLFAASDPDVTLTDESAGPLMSLSFARGFQTDVSEGYLSPVLKKIWGAWVGREVSARLTRHQFQLALNYDLREVLPNAEKTLAQTGASAALRYSALLAVGKFGDKQQISLVEPFLKDAEAPSTFRPGFHDSSHTQVRDAALVATIRLHGQQAADFGFPAIDDRDLFSHPNSRPISTEFLRRWGLLNDRLRAAAFKKWESFLTLRQAVDTGDAAALLQAQKTFDSAAAELKAAKDATAIVPQTPTESKGG